MAGGLMQLVAYGAQDIYLTGNPQITFFKAVYRRYTNFAIETIEQPFSCVPSFGRRVSAKILRSGDLCSKMYIRITISGVDPGNGKFAWVRRLGHAIVGAVDIELGGNRIDRHYGVALDIWYELARRGDHEVGYAKMIGDVPELTTYDSEVKPEYTLYIPLQFWFNRLVGLAIPLIALQYQDMFIHVTFQNVEQLVVRNSGFDPGILCIKDACVLVNYVFLDSEERRRFALAGHEYLIEQLQFNGVEQVIDVSRRYTLDYNHPVKEIVWLVKNGNFSSGKAFVYYTNDDVWDVNEAACEIIYKSVAVGVDPSGMVGGVWESVAPSEIKTVGTINMRNISAETVYVNPESLFIPTADGPYGITDKIWVNVVVTAEGKVQCNDVRTQLTVRDLSIPTCRMVDTRYESDDPLVIIFNCYGLTIDGKNNPVHSGVLLMNGFERFERREGRYFNYVQPDQHHSNTPRDGVNVYSFALHPEQHQPTGSSNFSRIERTDLSLRFADSTYECGLPDLGYFNENNELYIIGVNYNILRFLSGLSGLAYTV